MDRREQWGEPHSALATRPVLAIAIPLVLAVIGFAVPAAIPDGLGGLAPNRQAAGEHALRHAYLDCVDKFEHLFIRTQRLYWLDPEWQPGREAESKWPRRAVARVRAHALFGIPAGETTVLAGGGSACRRHDGGPEQTLRESIAQSTRNGNARWFIRLPDDAFPPIGVVGRIDFDRGRSVIDRPPPAELAGLPYYDAAAIFAAAAEAAPSWRYLGATDGGARFGLRDVALAVAGSQGPWVVVAVTVLGGTVESIEYALPSAPTLRPAVLRFFAYRQAESLDQPVALGS